MYEPVETRSPRCGDGRQRAAILPAREREVLDVAERLFIRHSFHQVSIATIATTVRVATKTIYMMFGGKLGLLHAVVQRDLHAWSRQITTIEQSGTDVRDQLEALAGLMLWRTLSPQCARLHADAFGERSTELAELVASVDARNRQVLERLIATLQSRQGGTAPSPTILGDAFVGCVLGRHIGAIVRGTSLHANREAFQQMAATAVAAFLDSIMPAARKVNSGRLVGLL